MESFARRPATDKDFEFAYQVKKAALGPYIEKTWGWDEDWQRNYHEEDFDASKLEIIQIAGEDIGTLEISHNESHLQLNEIYIHPNFDP